MPLRVVEPAWYVIGKEKLYLASEVFQQRQVEDKTLAYDSWFQWIDLLYCTNWAHDRRF